MSTAASCDVPFCQCDEVPELAQTPSSIISDRQDKNGLERLERQLANGLHDDLAPQLVRKRMPLIIRQGIRVVGVGYGDCSNRLEDDVVHGTRKNRRSLENFQK